MQNDKPNRTSFGETTMPLLMTPMWSLKMITRNSSPASAVILTCLSSYVRCGTTQASRSEQLPSELR